MHSGRLFHRRSLWLNPLIQLALAAALCVLIPFLVQSATLPHGWHDDEARHTAIAALIALGFGFWLHKNVGDLPGTRESSGILTGYTISFGLVLTSILLFRISYSRAILVAGFLLTISWFFAVYLVTQRRAGLSLGIVEGGRTDLFGGMPGVVSLPLTLDGWPDGLDAVTADFRQDHDDRWQARLTDFVLAGIPVYHSKDLYESLTGRAELEYLSENNFGALGPQSSLLFAKHLVDRLIAVPALILLSPVMLVAALAIRLDTGGPILFRQRRTGYRDRPFIVLKFRTMHRCEPCPGVNGPDTIERFVTRRNDPRITRVGAFLRRSRLDELPQIINILRGEMSWIGPRPEAAALSRWYQQAVPFYRYRYVVRPGITGWAQVNQGHVTAIDDVRTKLQFDFYYIRNFSVWLDLLIVAKTVKTMLTGFGWQ